MKAFVHSVLVRCQRTGFRKLSSIKNPWILAVKIGAVGRKTIATYSQSFTARLNSCPDTKHEFFRSL